MRIAKLKICFRFFVFWWNLCHFDVSESGFLLLGQQGSSFSYHHHRRVSPVVSQSRRLCKLLSKSVHFFMYFSRQERDSKEKKKKLCKKVYKNFNFLILFIAFLMRKLFHNLRKYNFATRPTTTSKIGEATGRSWINF